MYTRSLPANRQSLHRGCREEGARLGAATKPSERPVPGLSEESLSGLGAEKPGPYKEMLIRNEENNESIIKSRLISIDRDPIIICFPRDILRVKGL